MTLLSVIIIHNQQEMRVINGKEKIRLAVCQM